MPRPIALAGLLRLVDQQIGDDDTRAFFDVALGDRAADAAGPAGDDGDLVLKPHHIPRQRTALTANFDRA